MSMSEWEEDTPPQAENDSIKQIRENEEKQKKRAEKAEKELAELRQFKAEYVAGQRQAQVESILTEKGLPSGLARAFLAMNPDLEPSQENIDLFAADLNLTPSTPPPNEKSEETPTSQPPQPAGSTPGFEWHNPAAVGSTAVAPVKMTPAEFDSLVRTNPAAARQAQIEGRVEWTVVEQMPGVYGMRTKGT